MLNLANEIATGVPHANHQTICKFEQVDSQRYQPIWRAVRGLSKGALSEMRTSIQSAKTATYDSIDMVSPAARSNQGAFPQISAFGQGQQPMLNDALSFLDQNKVQLQVQPSVYSRFLDIMKDYKGQAIDTPGFIERILMLFAGYPELIQGFKTALPTGHGINSSLA